jgi:hypothetical protein
MVSHFYSAAEGVQASTTVQINLPLPQYEGLLGQCESWRGETQLLENGVMRLDGEGRSYVEITCDRFQAKMLLELASAAYPEAAPDIERSLSMVVQAEPAAGSLSEPDRHSKRLVKFRDHPLISYRGTPSWPPVWSKAGIDGNKTVTGEIGILRQVNHNAKLSKKCYLVIERDGVRYLGVLQFDNTAFGARICDFLRSNIGRHVKDIADCEIPFDG